MLRLYWFCLGVESPHFIINEPRLPHLHRTLYLPYLIAGLIGVPLGTWLLNIVEASTFRILLGIFLVIWCPLMLLNPQIKLIQHSGKTADAGIGLVGGILGGLGDSVVLYPLRG